MESFRRKIISFACITLCITYLPYFVQAGIKNGYVQYSFNAFHISDLDEPKLKGYFEDNKYFLEIHSTLIGRDILIVSRIAQSATDIKRYSIDGFGGYGGDKGNVVTIRFEQRAKGKLLLKTISFKERSIDSSENGMYRSFINSNLQPIAASFNIQPGVSSMWFKIDISELINQDNELLYFRNDLKPNLGLGVFQPSLSWIEGIITNPLSVAIRSVRTYSKTNGGQATFRMATYFMLLPETPMKPRYWDSRVGYFTQDVLDWDAGNHGMRVRKMIKRWRLEPRPEEMDNYKRGELVEPLKPIVFYIDPATPKVWIPFLIKGVEDWQSAFEQAGFKNAIIARMAPSKHEDSTWRIDDPRFSTILWQASEEENSSYSLITDPRSGEILSGHIKMYNNIISHIKKRFFIETAATNPRARQLDYDTQLMGELIGHVCSHEVGHVLGFPHNWGAHASVPTEKLRDKNWLIENGITSSIMDYCYFNFVAQPEDSITDVLALAKRIGVYDRWAIEWGYKLITGVSTPEQEVDTLNKWLAAKAGRIEFWNGGEYRGNDPRVLWNALGSDPIKASSYGIKNLQFIASHLVDWTTSPGQGYDDLRTMYEELKRQYIYLVNQVSALIGKSYEPDEHNGEIYKTVPSHVQKEAMSFLKKHVFTQPNWLMDTAILNRTNNLSSRSLFWGQSDQEGISVPKTAQGVLNYIMSTRFIMFMKQAENRHGRSVYTFQKLLGDLRNVLFPALKHNISIEPYQRFLQLSYIENLSKLITPNNKSINESDIAGIAREDLKVLYQYITSALMLAKDEEISFHIKEVKFRIRQILE